MEFAIKVKLTKGLLLGDSLGSEFGPELVSFVGNLEVMKMSRLTAHYWEINWDILMGLCLYAMKALN